MRTLADDSVSFDAVNAIVKAATLMSDEEDEANSTPGTHRRDVWFRFQSCNIKHCAATY